MAILVMTLRFRAQMHELQQFIPWTKPAEEHVLLRIGDLATYTRHAIISGAMMIIGGGRIQSKAITAIANSEECACSLLET